MELYVLMCLLMMTPSVDKEDHREPVPVIQIHITPRKTKIKRRKEK